MSSGSPNRTILARVTISRAAASESPPCCAAAASSQARSRSVRIYPGLTAFTCTPSRTPISASALVNDRHAPFTEPPMVKSGPGVRPPVPMMFSTAPRRCFRCGQAARTRRTAPKNFSAKPSVQSASESFRNSPRRVAPALFTTMSIAPNPSSAARTTAPGASGSRKSAASVFTLPPTLPIASAASANATLSRAAIITCAPSRANRNAMARPIPRLPPVTMAIFPARILLSSIVASV